MSCSCLAGDRFQLDCFLLLHIFFSLLPQNGGCIPLALFSCVFRATRIKRQALLPYIDYMFTGEIVVGRRCEGYTPVQYASTSGSSVHLLQHLHEQSWHKHIVPACFIAILTTTRRCCATCKLSQGMCRTGLLHMAQLVRAFKLHWVEEAVWKASCRELVPLLGC